MPDYFIFDFFLSDKSDSKYIWIYAWIFAIFEQILKVKFNDIHGNKLINQIFVTPVYDWYDRIRSS